MVLRLALALALALGCGPSGPPRTRVTSSAAEVSVAEGEGRSDEPLERPASLPAAEDADAGPRDDPATRRAGNLAVTSPPATASPGPPPRFRRHVEGGEAAGDPRVWVGIDVPEFVDLVDGSLELTVLDAGPEGYLAYYRDPVGASSCDQEGSATCAATAILYAPTGKKLWRYSLTGFLDRQRELEIRDLHYLDGVLYLAQGCPEGVRDEACGRIVAVDTRSGQVSWRSPPDAGVHRFSVLPTTLVGHGPSSVVVLDRASGRALDRQSVPFSIRDLDADGEEITAFGDGEATIRLRVSERGALQRLK